MTGLAVTAMHPRPDERSRFSWQIVYLFGNNSGRVYCIVQRRVNAYDDVIGSAGSEVSSGARHTVVVAAKGATRYGSGK